MSLPVAYPPPDRGTLVVWGLLGRHPFGGMVWQVLHHLVGLRRLGFDVWYVEDARTPVRDPETWESTGESEPTARYLDATLDAVGLSDRWILRDPSRPDHCLGARDAHGLRRLYREAQAVFNLCGFHNLREEHLAIECLVYLQTDPVATQVHVAQGEPWIIAELEAHHFLFTYGENLGRPGCGVPVERFQWRPTRAPVVLDWWSTEGPPPDACRLTTVANWKDLGKEIEWEGETYHWRKDRELRRFMDLPSRSPLALELALEGIGRGEAEELEAHGWEIVPARRYADPFEYRGYIRRSGGEFTVAKDQNVRLRSGWFSDRSACYLAAGRPVVTQDTGFGSTLPTGEGLFPFSTLEQALDAVREIAGQYSRHSRAAAEIAREYFDADRVLADVLREIGFV